MVSGGRACSGAGSRGGRKSVENEIPCTHAGPRRPQAQGSCQPGTNRKLFQSEALGSRRGWPHPSGLRVDAPAAWRTRGGPPHRQPQAQPCRGSRHLLAQQGDGPQEWCRRCHLG